jgi:hypothetical protein
MAAPVVAKPGILARALSAVLSILGRDAAGGDPFVAPGDRRPMVYSRTSWAGTGEAFELEWMEGLVDLGCGVAAVSCPHCAGVARHRAPMAAPTCAPCGDTGTVMVSV